MSNQCLSSNRFGGELFHTDDTPALIRKQMVKEFYMKEKFREEQVLAHVENPTERARIEKEMEAARVGNSTLLYSLTTF